jgi:hypothetical protein
MKELIKAWLNAKQAESEAIETRRNAEDAMLKFLRVSESMEGTFNAMYDDFQIKVIGRMNKKIDADLLQELAIEAGVSEHLSSLFRWKPEINSTAWKSADESITKPLLGAITTTPGRPSFSISIKE